ncbi:MAG: hypothetical protein JSR54_01445 [Proteobacteria bacterium]|nr:hypothetical protein [Pseudomonadota bacterium]
MDIIATPFVRRVRLLVQVAGLAALAVAGTARAGCADAQWTAARGDSVARVPAVYHPGGTLADSILRVSDSGDGAAIVGLWKFEMISKSTATHTNPMPDGTLIDFGTAAWHADGTELQTSGIRNPADGDVCQGVWQQVNGSTFVLNHYALAWTNGTYTGPVNIRARVTVDPTGQHFSGQFVTVVYLASATAGHEFDEGTVLATITGTFTGSRVTIR